MAGTVRSVLLNSFNINNLVVALCIALFLCQVIIIWIEFFRKETGISISVKEIEEKGKLLPCLTFCPLPGFKGNHNPESNLQNYFDETFGINETFPPKMIQQFDNSSNWLVKEVFTTAMGRCSMTCYNKKVQAIEFFNNATYFLNTSYNYQVV